jgi:CRISPR/Cas system-associated endonuclease Cas3-HD
MAKHEMKIKLALDLDDDSKATLESLRNGALVVELMSKQLEVLGRIERQLSDVRYLLNMRAIQRDEPAL